MFISCCELSYPFLERTDRTFVSDFVGLVIFRLGPERIDQWKCDRASCSCCAHHGWRGLKPVMTPAQSWSRRHYWLEPTSSSPIFKGLFLVIYKTTGFTFSIRWKNVENYYYAKLQANSGIFYYQIRWGLNRPILHPLWLMTSAAADVISVSPVWHMTPPRASGAPPVNGATRMQAPPKLPR